MTTYRIETWQADSSFNVAQNMKFENHLTRNDVIMTSLPNDADLLETKQIIYHSKGIDDRYPKMYFLLNFSHYVKSYEHLCQILTFFTMPALQIWPCHVTQEANF